VHRDQSRRARSRPEPYNVVFINSLQLFTFSASIITKILTALAERRFLVSLLDKNLGRSRCKPSPKAIMATVGQERENGGTRVQK
jgi:hypothetical protein